MNNEEWKKFFNENKAPASLQSDTDKLKQFCDSHKDQGIVLITSGTNESLTSKEGGHLYTFAPSKLFCGHRLHLLKYFDEMYFSLY